MLFVSITRARLACVVSYSRTRFAAGQHTNTTPSEFTVHLGKPFERKDDGITADVAQQRSKRCSACADTRPRTAVMASSRRRTQARAWSASVLQTRRSQQRASDRAARGRECRVAWEAAAGEGVQGVLRPISMEADRVSRGSTLRGEQRLSSHAAGAAAS